MKRLCFECLESRSLPAVNLFAGLLATDAPVTVNDSPPSEAAAFEYGDDQQSHRPQDSRPSKEFLVNPNGNQLEWDDGWWMLDFPHGKDSPPLDESLTQQPTSNQLDEWERFWFLDQPSHGREENGQPEDSENGPPKTLAHEEALLEFGGQRAKDDGNYFYSHAYTMFNNEPVPSTDGKFGSSSDTSTAPDPRFDEDPSASGSSSATDTKPNGQSGEVNVPDGGTILLGGIKRAEEVAENAGLRARG